MKIEEAIIKAQKRLVKDVVGTPTISEIVKLLHAEKLVPQRGDWTVKDRQFNVVFHLTLAGKDEVIETKSYNISFPISGYSQFFDDDTQDALKRSYDFWLYDLLSLTPPEKQSFFCRIRDQFLLTLSSIH